ncbi:S1 family peptidase [Vibrio sonorensis]|uniref:S1 family peptidase n=1 Tax=Vibrio sonorensis TaxID=1004316 RepID=UPI0008DAC7B5|nr:serine protease [Vibrio sonorensis]
MNTLVRIYLKTATLLLTLLYSQLSLASDEPFVILGDIVSDYRSSFMARIVRIEPETSNIFAVCSGSLIDDTHVLTAAHCFNEWDDNTFVALGTTNASQLTNELLEIKNVYVHESYEQNSLVHDIAIVNISKSAKLNLSKISISDNEQDYRSEYSMLSKDGLLYVNGYGATDPFSKTANSFLHSAEVDLITHDQCLGYRSNLRDTQLCSQFYSDSNGSFGAPCFGDSGGPLYYESEQESGKYIQVGIISFGSKSCSTMSGDNPTSVYTEVTDYQDWIFAAINGNLATVNPTSNQNDQSPPHYSEQSSGGGSISVYIVCLILFLSLYRGHHVYKHRQIVFE